MIFYHLLNRGVDKRKIFLNDNDHFRFIHDLFEFNDIAPVDSHYYRAFNQPVDIGCPPVGRGVEGERKRRPRKLLVQLHSFCLMPNHYHLFVSPLMEDGIPKFMKKMNMGYAKYFNEKYERSGALFQGKYKSIEVKTDPHFNYLPYYIHFNPLDLVMPEWRERKIKNYKKALKFLESYRWSSHLDYLGRKNFSSLTQREFLLDFFGGEKGYIKSLPEILKSFSVESLDTATLE